MKIGLFQKIGRDRAIHGEVENEVNEYLQREVLPGREQMTEVQISTAFASDKIGTAFALTIMVVQR